MASEEEDDNYVLVFAILEEAKLTHLKSIFKDNCLQVRLNILLSSIACVTPLLFCLE